MKYAINVTFLATIGTLTPFGLSTPVHVDQVRKDQWHLSALMVSEAHRYAQGDGVTVAVIDTGVALHPDLQINTLPGLSLLDASSDGRSDIDSHGTSMAGLIAAHGHGPEEGALGIAPHAKILPVRYRQSSEHSTNSTLPAAIRAAIDNGVSVVSISASGGPSSELQRAITAANVADVVVVAAVGNTPSSLAVSFPAAYDGVLAVGATDRDGNHAAVSVTGEQVAITAPGVDIYSTSIDGKYSKATGTSAATAIVSGAAALVRSKFPELSAREVVHRLTATAVDKGPPGRDEQYGYGVLDLVAALTADVPPLGSGGPAASSDTQGPAPPEGSDRGATVVIWAAVSVITTGVVAFLFLLRRRSKTL